MTALSELFPQLQTRRVRYVLALMLTVLALSVFLFREHPLTAAGFILLGGAVAAASIIGAWPAVAAVVSAALAFDFFFSPPVFRISFDSMTALAAICFAVLAFAARSAARWSIASGRDQKLQLLRWRAQERIMRNSRNSAEQPHELGRLDGYTDGELHGWALDAADEQRPLKLTLFIDGRPKAETLAVHYRSDVGPHAFYFDLSEEVEPNRRAEVDVRFADGRLISNTPFVITTPATRLARHKEAVLFMHISKTAGTAFREALAANYRQSEIAYVYPDAPGMLCQNLMLLPLEQRRGFRLVSGHFSYGIHNFLPQEYAYVTIVREPVARIISEHRYLREKRGGDAQKPAAESLIEMFERRQNKNLDNLLVRCFCGDADSQLPVGRITDEAFERALQNARERFCFIGHQERLGQAYDILREKFGWQPRGAFERVNTTRVGTPEEYASARSAIEHYNRWDLKLYSEILRLYPLS